MQYGTQFQSTMEEQKSQTISKAADVHLHWHFLGQRRTFSEPIAFESEESRGYCYCTIFFTESDLLLAYCAGGIEDKSCLARCRIRKIPWDTVVELENLLKGQK